MHEKSKKHKYELKELKVEKDKWQSMTGYFNNKTAQQFRISWLSFLVRSESSSLTESLQNSISFSQLLRY